VSSRVAASAAGGGPFGAAPPASAMAAPPTPAPMLQLPLPALPVTPARAGGAAAGGAPARGSSAGGVGRTSGAGQLDALAARPGAGGCFGFHFKTDQNRPKPTKIPTLVTGPSWPSQNSSIPSNACGQTFSPAGAPCGARCSRTPAAARTPRFCCTLRPFPPRRPPSHARPPASTPTAVEAASASPPCSGAASPSPPSPSAPPPHHPHPPCHP
jgi:hypothetical protein